MPSGQTRPQPMTMPFGGGFNSPFGGGMPFGGFGFPRPPQQPQIYTQLPTNYNPGTGDIAGTAPNGGPNAVAPQKNYGPIGGMVNTAQQQVQQPAPTGQMNNLMTNFAAPQPAPQQPTMQLPTPSMNGFASGTGRGKGRTGPGTSGGFSGGFGVTPPSFQDMRTDYNMASFGKGFS